MRLDAVLRYIGMVMLFVACMMLLSAGVSYVSRFDSSFYPLLLSALLTTLLGVFPLIFVERREQQLSSKEGFCVVVGSWLVACVVGTFPYLMWGGEFTLVNAWFESVSGFTTTGATVLEDIESLPRGLQFWRMASTWIGGMGVVMFALMILPAIGRSKMTLSNVELSTLAKDNYQYHTHIIVRILVVVYIGLTVISTLLLKLTGMNWFDALCHGMSSAATSGFSTKNTSLAYYNNPWIETVLIGTILTSGIHFGLIYSTVVAKKNNIFRSEVTRWYLGIVAVCSLMIAATLYFGGYYTEPTTAFRHAIFQVSSLITTSGFATADTSLWPPLAIVLLIFVSIICASSGSTSGGLKVNRLLLSLKMMSMRIKQQQHPNAVLRVRLDGIIQEEDVLHTVAVYIVIYFLLIFLGTLFATACGLDLMTSFSGAVAMIGNVGPGFGEVGSFSTYASMPTLLKYVDALLMLLGRLEIFGLIQLFLIKWWR